MCICLTKEPAPTNRTDPCLRRIHLPVTSSNQVIFKAQGSPLQVDLNLNKILSLVILEN